MAHDLEQKWRSKDVLVLENVDFSSMLLCDRVLAGLTKAGFKKPSPIQLEAIPTGRFGKDLLVQAKSGTGKTLVFVIVALEMLHRKLFRPQVLILVPTREIATQICSVVKSVGSYFPKLTCESFIGGFPVANDVKKAHGCQIVVGTPGRLKQLIEMKALSTNSIRLAIFDEADEVLQVSWLDEIDFIFNSLPEDKQVIATSATYPPKLKRIIIKYLRDPYLAQIDNRKLALLGIFHYVKVVESSAMPIKQYRLKLAALETILKNIKFTQCLVYCNGIHKVETLYRDIKKWGFSTTYISSNRDQAERLRAIDNLKRFKCKVLVSSDVTARGIDAENVDLVINFDVSNYTETYLHRSGRAGRYGTKGATISLVDLFELKYIEKIEKEAHFKSYELPDPVPNDLIQKPVLENYAIPTIIENSNEDSEEQSLSVNGNECPGKSNSEQCDNQSNDVSVTITDGNDRNSEVVNGVSTAAHVEPNTLTKEKCNNILNNEESQNNSKNSVVGKEREDNSTCMGIIDKSDGQKNSKDSESDNYVTDIENRNVGVVSELKNAKSHDTSNNTIESSVTVNECCDKENAESVNNGENYGVSKNVNSSIADIKKSPPECEISEVVSIKNSGENVVRVSENPNKMNAIEPSLLSVSEKMAEKSSKGDNSGQQSNDSEVYCAKDSENSLVSSNENSCDVSDKECPTPSTNKPGTEISAQQNFSGNPLTNDVESVNDFVKNELNVAVEDYVQKYESVIQEVLKNRNDSLEFKSSTAENSVSKDISLNKIRDLNSRRSDYYYKVFKHFQEVKSSKHSERAKEASKKREDSSVDKENSVIEPMPCSKVSSVEIHSTDIISNKLSLETVNELKIESSLQVPDTPAQGESNENDDDADILNFHQSPCHKSTPQIEKSKSKVTHLLDRGASEPPERNIMSFFDEVSDESASETESYHEISENNPSSRSSSDSESDSNSCTDSSSSSQSISSSNDDDDDSCDQDSTETSSSESHSSVDSLSVHSIEYSCRRDMKSLEKYRHPTALKQEKASMKKQQICHSERTGKRCQYPQQNPNHSYDFFNNAPQHSTGANYSNVYDKSNQFRHSKDHQASSNGQHFHHKKQNMRKDKSNFPQFLCNGQHSPACFTPSEHRCHPYHDSTPCNQRAICDMWYRIFCYQWQHIQNCSKTYF